MSTAPPFLVEVVNLRAARGLNPSGA